ncbi:DUF2610 domain-containing protein [Rickettsiales endosymbiont of Paramecium tredecaurelia]|uniref:DUF2610 domain-containing protein n=1 Tax=Candidatus Sarmatiella mevalonica TaxID=2770581 RepID=UPI001A923EE9|nr:DUF2610 domain-containing protein [Candidatus Sarmatiella mevalonica]MBL3284328.1 DUF2610 domain-containing protein [Candidatus Sarmatiella mevalonica]
MKKFVVDCDFGGQMFASVIYLGSAQSDHHPLYFQADIMSKSRGGTIPGPVMDAIGRLNTIALKNLVELDALCVYAIGSAQIQTSQDSQEASVENEEE